MFAGWGRLVYKLRYTVIGLMVAVLLGLGAYGLGLEDHLSQSGFDDPGSDSVAAAQLLDKTYGRDHNSDVLALYTAPPGKTIDDPQFAQAIQNNLNSLVKDHPDQILKVNVSYYPVEGAINNPLAADKEKQHAVASIGIVGNTDTELTQNFQKVKSNFYIDGVDVQLAGLQPVFGTINDTMQNDIHRMELLAIPVVGVLLFFIFGGIVAAALPLIVGGLTVVGAWGVVRVITMFTEVNAFVSPVVSLIGLGLAIDYGLFIVSRFREELAEGYSTEDAVRRSVMTAGRTVVFSATMIVASLAGLLLFPQGFLKSVAYGAIATVSLAALAAITVLPGILGILGPRVDAFGLKRFRKTKTAEEVEASFWGRLTRFVMKHPLKVAIPIVIGLLLLIIPVNAIKFGGISEKYLPPDNETRVAQQQFDSLFPNLRTEPIKLVITGANSTQVTDILKEASNAPGLVQKFTLNPLSPAKDNVFRSEAGLEDRNVATPAIDYLRSMDVPDGVKVGVTGTPAIEADSVTALLDRMPLMIILVVLSTTLLMFLTFGSLVLPIKAALMSALGLGSTLGILTWIFVDGHGSGILNFTPGPVSSPVLVLIIAVIYGLSTDYEVFLLSRMVEARAMGASTTEAVRIGTAHTGRIITAAALILIVVTGAFGFSDLVMMQYIAYGMIAALIIDATLIRMFLVPATMKLLGDDCWWAPAWMKRIQEKLGLGEPLLHEQNIPHDVPDVGPAAAPHPVGRATHHHQAAAPEPLTEPLPRISATPPVRAVRPQPRVQKPTPPPADRNSSGIESWLADLRGSTPRPTQSGSAGPLSDRPQRPPASMGDNGASTPPAADPPSDDLDDDTGRHRRSADHPAVSVSELLERENRH
ncbi:MMPL family transporter [Antrihabitans spumae]|uniref:MMPL family transporter n=1 Tax=Antrihabitans spumae TaxID=3373370 RepID=A0ABW7K149_9NOCA